MKQEKKITLSTHVHLASSYRYRFSSILINPGFTKKNKKEIILEEYNTVMNKTIHFIIFEKQILTRRTDD